MAASARSEEQKAIEGTKGSRWALTGSMGSGKSTVLELFEEAGWTTMDSDRVVRELLNADPEVHTALRDRWGGQVFSEKDEVNRSAVGQIVFSDDQELAWLEGLLHPKVRKSWMHLIETSGLQPVIVEIPLLFEKQLHTFFDQSICLSISEPLQIKRLARRGVDEGTARKRLSRQLSTVEKVKLADRVICNDGSLEFLSAQVGVLLANS